MGQPSDIAIGLPVHNGAAHLRESLDSLLSQTCGDFNVLVLDDASTDGSDAILREYAARDGRLRVVRVNRRLGLIGAWRRAARLAAKLFRPKYFAWYSDHDWVSPDWLEHLHAAATQPTRPALAHARTVVMDAEGQQTVSESPALDTSGLQPLQRIERVVFSNMGAGDAVYGLFRWDVIAACGVFRGEIMPDRLLVSEANVHGEIVHVPQATRFRRRTHVFSGKFELVDRQMKTLFPGRYKKTAPYISHATCLLRLASNARGTDPEMDLAKNYLAFMHYERCLGKFSEPLQQEIAAANGAHRDPVAQLIANNLDAPVLIPAWDGKAWKRWKDKEQRYEALVNESGEKIQSLKERFRLAERVHAEYASKLLKAHRKLAGSREQLAARSAELSEARQQLAATSAQLGETREQLAAASTELRDTHAKLAVASAELSEGRAARGRVEAELEIARAALDVAHADTRTLSEQLQIEATARAQVEGELAVMREALDGTQAQLLALSEQLQAATLARSLGEAAAARLQTKLNDARAVHERLLSRYKRVRLFGAAALLSLKMSEWLKSPPARPVHGTDVE